MREYLFGPCLIVREDGETFAAIPPEGSWPSPNFVTKDISRAARFASWGDASDASQNFGPEWTVEEM